MAAATARAPARLAQHAMVLVLFLATCVVVAHAAVPYDEALWNYYNRYEASKIPSKLLLMSPNTLQAPLFPLDLGWDVQAECYSPARPFPNASAQRAPGACEFVPTGNFTYRFWQKLPGERLRQANCYCYAVDRFEGGWCFPGLGSGMGELSPTAITCDDLTARVVSDGGVPVTREVAVDGPVPTEGHYIAMFYRPESSCDFPRCGPDFHFARRDEDGIWSHKPGLSPVSNKDSDGVVMTDPEEANINGQYTDFCGYFLVEPAKVRVGVEHIPDRIDNLVQRWRDNGLEVRVTPLPYDPSTDFIDLDKLADIRLKMQHMQRGNSGDNSNNAQQPGDPSQVAGNLTVPPMPAVPQQQPPVQQPPVLQPPPVQQPPLPAQQPVQQPPLPVAQQQPPVQQQTPIVVQQQPQPSPVIPPQTPPVSPQVSPVAQPAPVVPQQMQPVLQGPALQGLPLPPQTPAPTPMLMQQPQQLQQQQQQRQPGQQNFVLQQLPQGQQQLPVAQRSPLATQQRPSTVQQQRSPPVQQQRTTLLQQQLLPALQGGKPEQRASPRVVPPPQQVSPSSQLQKQQQQPLQLPRQAVLPAQPPLKTSPSKPGGQPALVRQQLPPVPQLPVQPMQNQTQFAVQNQTQFAPQNQTQVLQKQAQQLLQNETEQVLQNLTGSLNRARALPAPQTADPVQPQPQLPQQQPSPAQPQPAPLSQQQQQLQPALVQPTPLAPPLLQPVPEQQPAISQQQPPLVQQQPPQQPPQQQQPPQEPPQQQPQQQQPPPQQPPQPQLPTPVQAPQPRQGARRLLRAA